MRCVHYSKTTEEKFPGSGENCQRNMQISQVVW